MPIYGQKLKLTKDFGSNPKFYPLVFHEKWKIIFGFFPSSCKNAFYFFSAMPDYEMLTWDDVWPQKGWIGLEMAA